MKWRWGRRASCHICSLEWKQKEARTISGLLIIIAEMSYNLENYYIYTHTVVFFENAGKSFLNDVKDNSLKTKIRNASNAASHEVLTLESNVLGV